MVIDPQRLIEFTDMGSFLLSLFPLSWFLIFAIEHLVSSILFLAMSRVESRLERNLPQKGEKDCRKAKNVPPGGFFIGVVR